MHGITCLTFFLWTFLRCVLSESTTTVVAKAPVKPVKEREILSLHCQVWDIQPGYIVTLGRELKGENQVFSFDKGVVQGVDDRTYLAVRQLRDGSSVYFLTITEVTKDDEGVYRCQVIRKGAFNVLAMHSVHIPIQYFPSEKPSCTPNTLPMRYKAGTELQLNCSSVIGHPVVKFAWTRAGSDITRFSKQQQQNITTYSTLTITLTGKDNDAVFMCLVTSSAFRRQENRCHIGPITVIPNPEFIFDPTRDTTLMPPPVIPPRPLGPGKVIPIPNLNGTDDCTEVCRSPPTVKYWILACSAAGALALIFLLSVMILLIKYCQSSKETQPKQRRKGKSSKHHPTEEIYTELEYHRDQQRASDANKLYMSLQKQPPQNPEQPQQAEEEEAEGRGGGSTGVTTGTPVVYKSHYV